MGGTFYLIGIALAFYAGLNELQWYFIFISSLIMTIGWFIIRAPQIHDKVPEVVSFPKLLSIQVIIFSIITAPTYFIAMYLN